MPLFRILTVSSIALSLCMGAATIPSLVPSAAAHSPQSEHKSTKHRRQARIQIALLLDTSNSMDGLIAQAKSQLWTLVNEVSEGKKYGHRPRIELSLYEYGNSNLSISSGYVRQVLPLTTDLDLVSEKLFSLRTDGGQEYAGKVIMTALDDLEWSQRKEDMKLIIIAGNEPFTQGPVNYETACGRARRKGVIIDTIHCGDEQTGIRTKWEDGADCAGGIYMTINQDEKSVHYDTPYDDDLRHYNQKLNSTYYGYGRRGASGKMRQMAQDSNAESMSPSIAAKRAKSKTSGAYSNESWDVVDGYAKKPSAILEMKESELPSEMKGMTKDQRKVFVESKAKERKSVQKKIKSLTKKREEFIAEKRKESAKTKTLDNVMVDAVRRQAQEQGFSYSGTN